MNAWLVSLPSDLQILIEVGVAMLFGAAIGFEREWANRPAGLRTHMLVAAASALMVGVATGMIDRYAAEPWAERLSIDPVRVMEAIAVGVSFLGAGTIIHRRDNQHVEGLTTAASLLLVAAIGITVALKMIVLAAGITALILIALRGLMWLERAVPPKDRDAHTVQGRGSG